MKIKQKYKMVFRWKKDRGGKLVLRDILTITYESMGRYPRERKSALKTYEKHTN